MSGVSPLPASMFDFSRRRACNKAPLRVGRAERIGALLPEAQPDALLCSPRKGDGQNSLRWRDAARPRQRLFTQPAHGQPGRGTRRMHAALTDALMAAGGQTGPNSDMSVLYHDGSLYARSCEHSL